MLRALLVCMFVGNSRGRPTALDPGEPFVDASVALTCPTCGRLGDGDPNCCSPGGSWHGMCEGGAGGGQYTFHDGYQACSGEKLAASVLPGMPFSCPGTKPDKRVDCGDYGSEQGCLAYGCCFNALPPGEVGPSCYLPTVPEPTYEEAHKAMFYIYFVLLPGNAKHSGSEYAAWLQAGCARLTKAGKTFALLGDVEWIQSVAPTCKLANKKASKQFSFDALPKPRAIANLTAKIGGDCSLKGTASVPWGQFRTFATIWHSKLGVLCDAARQRPDELSVLLDGGLMYTPIAEPHTGRQTTAAEEVLHRSISRAEELAGLGELPTPLTEHTIRGVDAQMVLSSRAKMALGWVDTDQRERERENGKLQLELYFEDGRSVVAPAGRGHCLFNRPECCANDQRVAAGAMALRGVDCDAVEGAYMEALTEIAFGACTCYDEEIVLTRMLNQAPWKSLTMAHFGP